MQAFKEISCLHQRSLFPRYLNFKFGTVKKQVNFVCCNFHNGIIQVKISKSANVFCLCTFSQLSRFKIYWHLKCVNLQKSMANIKINTHTFLYNFLLFQRYYNLIFFTFKNQVKVTEYNFRIDFIQQRMTKCVKTSTYFCSIFYFSDKLTILIIFR